MNTLNAEKSCCAWCLAKKKEAHSKACPMGWMYWEHQKDFSVSRVSK